MFYLIYIYFATFCPYYVISKLKLSLITSIITLKLSSLVSKSKVIIFVNVFDSTLFKNTQ